MEKLRKIGKIMSHLRAEPAAVFCVTGLVLGYMRTENILLRRICEVDFQYDKEICDNYIKQNGTDESLEVEIQKEMTHIKSYTSLFVVINCLVILIAGPLSDIWGRKFLLVLPCIGNILQPISIILLVEYTNCRAIVISFVNQGLMNLGGNHVLFGMALFCHIVDITGNEERTLRLGIAEAFYGFGPPLASLVGALLSDYEVGDIETLYVSIGFTAASLLIVIVFMKEEKNVKKGEDESCDANCIKIGKEFVLTMFKKREGGGRLKLWLLVIAYLFIMAPFNGEFQLLYLFLRKRLNWDLSDYSYFNIALSSIRAIGMGVSIWLFSTKMKLSDPLIGIISGLSNMCACVSYAFSYTAWAMYLSSVIDVLNGTLSVMPRTIISKLVSVSEAGTIFTILAIINAALPSGLVPLYTLVYNRTIEIDFEGGYNLLSLALCIPPTLILMWLYYKYRQDLSKQRKLKDGSESFDESSSSKSVINRIYTICNLYADPMNSPIV